MKSWIRGANSSGRLYGKHGSKIAEKQDLCCGKGTCTYMKQSMVVDWLALLKKYQIAVTEGF